MNKCQIRLTVLKNIIHVSILPTILQTAFPTVWHEDAEACPKVLGHRQEDWMSPSQSQHYSPWYSHTVSNINQTKTSLAYENVHIQSCTVKLCLMCETQKWKPQVSWKRTAQEVHYNPPWHQLQAISSYPTHTKMQFSQSVLTGHYLRDEL